MKAIIKAVIEKIGTKPSVIWQITLVISGRLGIEMLVHHQGKYVFFPLDHFAFSWGISCSQSQAGFDYCHVSELDKKHRERLGKGKAD